MAGNALTDTVQANTITDRAGTGAPNFSQGVLLSGGSLKADTITDAAGTGAPDFTQGLKLASGTTDLSVYREVSSSWTASGTTVTWYAVRVGRLVSVSFWTGTLISTSTTSGASDLPSEYRPNKGATALVEIGSAGSITKIFISTAGLMRLETVLVASASAGGSLQANTLYTISYNKI